MQTDSDLRAQPIPELFRRLSEDASTLLRQEVSLARSELKAEARTAGVCAALLGIGALFGTVSFLAITAAIGLALSLVMPSWAAALIVWAVYAVIAGMFATFGVAQARRVRPPAKTVRNLKDGLARMEPTVGALAYKANLIARAREGWGRVRSDVSRYFRERVATKL